MKKNYLFLLTLLVVLAGCGPKDKKKTKASKPKKATTIAKKIDVQDTTVEIPLASDEIKSYFDDKDVNLGEFVLVEDSEVESKDLDTNVDVDTTVEQKNEVAQLDAIDNEINLTQEDLDDFSWVQEIEKEDEKFEKCHFEFDKYDVKEDQEKKIEDNIKLAKKILDEGGEPTIVIEGHSCHSAGSMTYNLALSEKRAKAIADRFVNAGVSRENIKIVGRGQECPEKDENGNDITGDRQRQWVNRRSEVRVVYV